MPRVTGLDPVKRRSGWLEVQLDGAESCRLPQEEVWRLGLESGVELTDAEWHALRLAAECAEALRVGLRYLSTRPRSRREVERRLGRDRLSGPAIDRTLDRFGELGYLNDAEFAASFARDRIRLRPCGVRRMRADLMSRGVSSGDADAGITAAMSDEDVTEADLLDRVAAARAARLAGGDGQVARRRLFDYLARRGFASSDVRAWIEVHWPETDEHGGVS